MKKVNYKWKRLGQNTFKDKPAFIKRLIKLRTCLWYIAAAAATKDLNV